jgi:hypothetical protein
MPLALAKWCVHNVVDVSEEVVDAVAVLLDDMLLCNGQLLASNHSASRYLHDLAYTSRLLADSQTKNL